MKTMTQEAVFGKEAVKAPQVSKLCIILSKGSLDMAYPAFMLANAAAAMGYEVHLFFTFWGMNVIDRRKIDNLKVSSVGNPGLPLPNILGMLPGMTSMVTGMLKGKMAKQKVPTIRELVKTAKDLGVKLHACSTNHGRHGPEERGLHTGGRRHSGRGNLHPAERRRPSDLHLERW
jgi:peroxiredoxin family protein